MAMLKNIILFLLINIVVCSAASPFSIHSERILRNVPEFYCVANEIAPSQDLQAAIEYVCGRGVNCGRVRPGGDCYNPNNLNFHASVVINAYYRAHHGQGFYCNGDGPLTSVGQLIYTNPSQGSCKFD